MSTDVLISNRLSASVNAVPINAATEWVSSVQFPAEQFSSTRFSAVCFFATQSVKGNAFQPESGMWTALGSASSEYSHGEARLSKMPLEDWID